MKNDLEGQRIDAFDIAKGIAIICVILGHLGIYNINRVVYTFHMPIFFLISGYFLKRNSSELFTEFYQKRFKGIMWPYITTCFFICALSIPMSLLLGESVAANLYKWIGGSLYGSGLPDSPNLFKHFPSFIGALWFLPALFIGSNIAKKIIDNDKNDIQSLGMAIILFYIGYKTSERVWLPFDIQAGLTASLFLLLGYLAKKYQILYMKIPVYIYFLLGGISFWNIKYFSGLWFVKNYFGNGIFDILAALSTSFVIIKICFLVSSRLIALSKVLKWYGKNSIIVLAFHIIELNIFPWKCFNDWFLYSFNLEAMHSIKGLFCIILLKLAWVTFGVIVANNIYFLHYLYSGGKSK